MIGRPSTAILDPRGKRHLAGVGRGLPWGQLCESAVAAPVVNETSF